MNKLKFLFSLYILFISCLFAQVNTESMRKTAQFSGIQHQLEFDFAYISGNTDLFELEASYRLDYLSNSKWYGFLVWKYDRAFERFKEDYTYRGFGHLRLARSILYKTDIEGFLQKEFNYFLDLENRELFGLGVRYNPMQNLFLGTGLMNELEEYKSPLKENIFLKSTNYLNYTLQLLEIVQLQNIVYFQFKLDDFGAYRVLWDGKLVILGLKGVSFHINCHYRIDNNSINSHYFEITNGLGFSF